tara:strand:- start:3954 stop:4208 length:255 start_codon:yes stop_codon:yes gene_type:complete
MAERFQKTNMPGMVKDHATGAILNTNKDAFVAYKSRKAKIMESNNRIDSIEMVVANLQVELQKSDDKITEIHSMLKAMVGNNGG